jgi:Fic family protein
MIIGGKLKNKRSLPNMFEPHYQITPRISKALMVIESCRTTIEGLPITANVLISLRESARLAATHYSTFIEGNRLTEEQVEKVIVGQAHFPGRKRDEAEVRNYYAALTEIETIAQLTSILSDKHIQTIHALVETGRRKLSPYRDGQNVIRDGGTGKIVYMPPEAKDVPKLMKELVEWINQSIGEGDIPIPIIAALTHYQFVTIHPYFDGNGRTGRLLTTLVLHMNGYALKGIYALEEYYAVNLSAYYNALNVGDTHNYYFGRIEADVTEFVDYFCIGMATAFTKVKEQAERAQRGGRMDQSQLLRTLSPRKRQALSLFQNQSEVTAAEIGKIFNLSPRNAQYLCHRWVEDGFLKMTNPSKKKRLYGLVEDYEALVDGQ